VTFTGVYTSQKGPYFHQERRVIVRDARCVTFIMALAMGAPVVARSTVTAQGISTATILGTVAAVEPAVEASPITGVDSDAMPPIDLARLECRCSSEPDPREFQQL
jgi:hypothetical protein